MENSNLSSPLIEIDLIHLSQDDTASASVISPSGNINVLEDSSEIANLDFPEVYINSLSRSHNFTLTNITTCLNNRDQETLTKVRELLIEKVYTLQPNFLARKPKTRKVKHKIIEDIIALGACVAKDEINSEVEKIFGAPYANIAEMFRAMQWLHGKVLELENEISILKARSDSPTDLIQADEGNAQRSETPLPFTRQTPSPNQETIEFIPSSQTPTPDQETIEFIPTSPDTDRSTFGSTNNSDEADGMEEEIAQRLSEERRNPQQGLTENRPTRQENLEEDTRDIRMSPKPGSTTDLGQPQNNSDIYIGGVAKHETTQNVVEELVYRKLRREDVTVRHHQTNNNGVQSFVATIPTKMLHRVFKGPLWPKGITVQPFVSRPRRRQLEAANTTTQDTGRGTYRLERQQRFQGRRWDNFQERPTNPSPPHSQRAENIGDSYHHPKAYRHHHNQFRRGSTPSPPTYHRPRNNYNRHQQSYPRHRELQYRGQHYDQPLPYSPYEKDHQRQGNISHRPTPHDYNYDYWGNFPPPPARRENRY